MKYKKIVIIGGGVLGSQIAFQTAYCGYDVTIWLRSEESIKRTKEKIDKLYDVYLSTVKSMKNNGDDWACGIAPTDKFDYDSCIEKVKNAYETIKYELDINAALKNADLVIESLTELKEEKTKFYKMVSPLLDKKTVVVTNSSTMLPSTFANLLNQKEKFLSLHFANSIWKNNTAEVMGHNDTSKKYFDEVVDFASSINMIPLPIFKEKSGYLLNSMLVPFLLSGLDLYANGVSTPENIDKAWTLGTGAPKGPFRIIDTVGLMTAKNIVVQYQKVPGLINPLLKKMMLPYNYKKMLEILDEYINAGKLGESSGEGFYKYKDNK